MLGFTAADVINRLTPAYISDPDELVARTESLSREYVDRVKELYPDTLRIVLSGYTDLESIMEAINRGAIYRFYTKPWDNLQLRNNIQEAFSHYRLCPPQTRHAFSDTLAAPLKGRTPGGTTLTGSAG